MMVIKTIVKFMMFNSRGKDMFWNLPVLAVHHRAPAKSVFILRKGEAIERIRLVRVEIQGESTCIRNKDITCLYITYRDKGKIKVKRERRPNSGNLPRLWVDKKEASALKYLQWIQKALSPFEHPCWATVQFLAYYFWLSANRANVGDSFCIWSRLSWQSDALLKPWAASQPSRWSHRKNFKGTILLVMCHKAKFLSLMLTQF